MVVIVPLCGRDSDLELGFTLDNSKSLDTAGQTLFILEFVLKQNNYDVFFMDIMNVQYSIFGQMYFLI